MPTSARYFCFLSSFGDLLVVTLIYQCSSETPIARCHLLLAVPLCLLIWLKTERSRVGFVLGEEREILQSLSSSADNCFVVSTQGIWGILLFCADVVLLVWVFNM